MSAGVGLSWVSDLGFRTALGAAARARIPLLLVLLLQAAQQQPPRRIIVLHHRLPQGCIRVWGHSHSLGDMLPRQLAPSAALLSAICACQGRSVSVNCIRYNGHHGGFQKLQKLARQPRCGARLRHQRLPESRL